MRQPGNYRDIPVRCRSPRVRVRALRPSGARSRAPGGCLRRGADGPAPPAPPESTSRRASPRPRRAALAPAPRTGRLAARGRLRQWRCPVSDSQARRARRRAALSGRDGRSRGGPAAQSGTEAGQPCQWFHGSHPSQIPAAQSGQRQATRNSCKGLRKRRVGYARGAARGWLERCPGAPVPVRVQVGRAAGISYRLYLIVPINEAQLAETTGNPLEERLQLLAGRRASRIGASFRRQRRGGAGRGGAGRGAIGERRGERIGCRFTEARRQSNPGRRRRRVHL